MLKQMTLKHISLFVILTSILGFAACNDDNNAVTTIEASNDARIFSFLVKAGGRKNAIDSIAYPVLDVTKFAITESTYLDDGLIYNPDSLPFGTRIATFATTMGLASQAPTGIRILNKIAIEGKEGEFEKNKFDSIWWNKTDSIDFTKLDHFKIFPASGDITKARGYRIEFRIHTVDPDTILWGKADEQYPALNYTADKIKTILKDNIFYCYTIAGNVIKLSAFDPTAKIWTNKTLSNFPSSVRLESLSLLKSNFYAVDTEGKGYASSDGFTWSELTSDNEIHSILGVLPNENKLLTVVTQDNIKRFASTENLRNFEVLSVKGSSSPQNDIPKNFSSHGFSSVVEDNTEKSIFITGGKGFDGNLKNTTWALAFRNGTLEVANMTGSQTNKVISPNENIATFEYDKRLYAVNDSVFAIADAWGYRWKVAPKKQALPAKLTRGLGQSVIVDKQNNFIWLFAKNDKKNVAVWRGRLTRLSPKIK